MIVHFLFFFFFFIVFLFFGGFNPGAKPAGDESTAMYRSRRSRQVATWRLRLHRNTRPSANGAAKSRLGGLAGVEILAQSRTSPSSSQPEGTVCCGSWRYFHHPQVLPPGRSPPKKIKIK